MSSRTSQASEERADARFSAQIAAHYRDYLAYLDARLRLLAVAKSSSEAAFERAEARDDERAGRAALAALPPASRALFDALLEQERAALERDRAADPAARAHTTDPDAPLREALETLRDEALGIGTENGQGLLPRGTPEAIKWYAVDVAALQAAPTAAAYTAGPDRRARGRIVLQAGAAFAVLLLALIVLLLPKGAPTQTNILRAASVNGSRLTAWPIVALELRTHEGDITTLTVSPTEALDWPMSGQEAQASWRTRDVWPLRLCLPAARLADIAGVRLLGGGATPARVYSIATDRAADLLVESCEGGSPPPLTLGLRATALLADQAIGAPARWASGAITVTAIAVTGPGEDPDLPADTARVAVRVASDAQLDWPPLAPTLLLPSGAAALPSETTPISRGVELRYLIPLPDAPLPVAWGIAPAPDAPAIRWRATLEPPPSRAAVLREVLAVEAPQVAPGSTADSLLVSVLVTNRRSTPLQLRGADVALLVNGQPLSTPDLPDLRAPLAPHAQRRLTIPLSLGDRATLTLTIGVARFVVERAEGR